MPEPISVVLADYNPQWPHIAKKLAQDLRVLGSNLLVVHHIGSTSVPGLAAKPIIDLLPVVNDVAELDGQRPLLEGLGYEWHGELGIPGRRYCTLSHSSGARAAQLHCFQTRSPHLVRHIAFRDYLRSHPHVARAYENEKRRAQSLHAEDSHAYSDEKAG
jgi:GrpB-like predicted nucleotidyltransferase (UPF0157 family)